MRYYTEDIKELDEDQFFVFGSNLAGVHGAGAAKFARKHFGASLGVGSGFSGKTYAIPTKDHNIRTMCLAEIKYFVDLFIEVANDNPEFDFYVTKIGCGLAGYKDYQIAPMFKDAPDNCYFHIDWLEYLEDK